jgi:hypothetical protein
VAPSAPSVAAHADSRQEREALAARRLAAMGIKSGDTGSGSGSGSGNNTSQFIAGASAPPLEGGAELNLRSLLDMGFQRDEARAALQASGNSLDGALAKLTP